MSLYKPHHDAFIRFCSAKAYGAMETEDLVNETIAGVYENLSSLKSDQAFLSYLFSTATNIIRKQIRRKKLIFYQNELSDQAIHEISNQPEIKLDIEILYGALNQIPVAQKEAIILFEISGYSLKEISQMVHTSESNIKQRLRRGRIKLAELLGERELKNEPVVHRSKVLYNLFL